MPLTFDQLPIAVDQLCEDVAFLKRHLLEKSHDDPQSDELLTIQQTAELLNLQVSTIYGLVSRMEIPCMKKGKRLYFSKEELIGWLKSGRKKTSKDISSEADTFLRKRETNNR